MADEKKIIDVEVREKGLDELNVDLAKTEQSFKEVDAAADKTSKSVDDVASNGGAIAILDSMTGGLATRMRDAYEATKLFNFSLKGMRTALIATGIGALVVALGLIVAYWDDIVEFIKGANKELQKQIDLNKELQEGIKFELELLELKQKLLEIEGKSTKEVLRLKRELIIELQNENNRELELLKTQAARITARQLEVTLWERIVAAAKGDFSGVSALQMSEEDVARMKEITEAIKGASKETLQLNIALAELDKTESGPGAEPIDPVTGEELSTLDTSAQAATDLLAKQGEERNKAFQKNEFGQVKIAKIHSDLRSKIFKTEQESKMIALQSTADAIMAFGDLVGQQTGAGKALASASALINTFLGITEVWSTKSVLLEPFATISRIANTVAVAASGFAAVKSINQVRIPNVSVSSPTFSGGGGAAVPSPISIQQPDFNVIGNSGINQLADVIAEQERKPQRAYVVSEDIETNAELDRRIESSASIG